MNEMTETRQDGGPAFPRYDYDARRTQNGMSLRDWFAGQALSGFLANSRLGVLSEENPEGQIAMSAYALADAMIKERSK
jgi:hypothetical protein